MYRHEKESDLHQSIWPEGFYDVGTSACRLYSLMRVLEVWLDASMLCPEPIQQHSGWRLSVYNSRLNLVLLCYRP